MKRLLILAGLLASLTSYAQVSKKDYSSYLNYVGTTSRHIIDLQNTLSEVSEVNSKLREVESDPAGGYLMYYHVIYHNNDQTYVYYFSEKNICWAYRIIQSLEAQQQEVEEIKHIFTKIDSKTYVHPTLDLKAVIDADSSLGSITYEHKKP